MNPQKTQKDTKILVHKRHKRTQKSAPSAVRRRCALFLSTKDTKGHKKDTKILVHKRHKRTQKGQKICKEDEGERCSNQSPVGVSMKMQESPVSRRVSSMRARGPVVSVA